MFFVTCTICYSQTKNKTELSFDFEDTKVVRVSTELFGGVVVHLKSAPGYRSIILVLKERYVVWHYDEEGEHYEQALEERRIKELAIEFDAKERKEYVYDYHKGWIEVVKDKKKRL